MLPSKDLAAVPLGANLALIGVWPFTCPEVSGAIGAGLTRRSDAVKTLPLEVVLGLGMYVLLTLPVAARLLLDIAILMSQANISTCWSDLESGGEGLTQAWHFIPFGVQGLRRRGSSCGRAGGTTGDGVH